MARKRKPKSRRPELRFGKKHIFEIFFVAMRL